MENNDVQQPDPLTMIGEARTAAAERLVTPWWYHPILGLLLAGHLVAFSFGDTLVRSVATLLFLAGIALLVQTYRRLTGVWISGFEAGRASRWAYAMGALVGVLMVASLVIVWTTSLAWPTWVMAAVVGVAVVVRGRRFDVALRAQLRAGA